MSEISARQKPGTSFNDARYAELKAKNSAKSITPLERLEYRKMTLSMRKVSLAKQEQAIREGERKADAHRKIKLGGLVIASGLGDWDEATLRGAMLQIAATTDTVIIAAWRKAGGAEFNADAKSRNDAAVRLFVQFPEQPPDNVRTALRGKGLEWVRDRMRWEGKAVLDDISAIAGPAGGQVEMLAG
jgi:hypothetical protein